MSKDVIATRIGRGSVLIHYMNEYHRAIQELNEEIQEMVAKEYPPSVQKQMDRINNIVSENVSGRISHEVSFEPGVYGEMAVALYLNYEDENGRFDWTIDKLNSVSDDSIKADIHWFVHELARKLFLK